MTPNELLTKNDLLLFKSDLLEEFKKFIDQGSTPKESTYLKSKDGDDTKLYRIYPRDYWMTEY